jgi:hypothetical protein
VFATSTSGVGVPYLNKALCISGMHVVVTVRRCALKAGGNTNTNAIMGFIWQAYNPDTSVNCTLHTNGQELLRQVYIHYSLDLVSCCCLVKLCNTRSFAMVRAAHSAIATLEQIEYVTCVSLEQHESNSIVCCLLHLDTCRFLNRAIY